MVSFGGQSHDLRPMQPLVDDAASRVAVMDRSMPAGQRAVGRCLSDLVRSLVTVIWWRMSCLAFSDRAWNSPTTIKSIN